MTTPHNLLDRLRSFPALLARELDAVPAGAFDFVPQTWEGVPSERLTIRQQICHLRDIEIDGYAPRFARTLKEERPFLPSIESYGLISARNYDETSPFDALEAFTAARLTSLTLLHALGSDDFVRPAAFEGYGEVTLLGLVHFLASHDAQHLAGLHWLLGAYASRR